jgi:hypothetical protein
VSEAAAVRPDRSDSAPRARDGYLRMLRAVWMFALALLLVAVLWELYKVVGPQDGGTIFGWKILPRANDQAMPHVWQMLARFGEPERAGFPGTILTTILSGAWFTFRPDQERSRSGDARRRPESVSGRAEHTPSGLVAAGITVSTAVGVFAPWEVTLLAGWDAALAVYVAWVWASVGALDAQATQRVAGSEDLSHAAAEFVLIAEDVMNLVAVALALALDPAVRRAGWSKPSPPSVSASLTGTMPSPASRRRSALSLGDGSLVDCAGQLQHLCRDRHQLLDLRFSRLDGLPLMIRYNLPFLVRPVLANQDEGGQEDSLERHDHREETERILLEGDCNPQSVPDDAEIDEVHRPGETGDRVGQPVLELGPSLLRVFSKRGVARPSNGRLQTHDLPPPSLASFG